jgi:hypothetical protein
MKAANNDTAKAPFPLPEGKSPTLNYRGTIRHYNEQTGKYNLGL